MDAAERARDAAEARLQGDGRQYGAARVDLTSFPAVAIDPPGTGLKDDAVAYDAAENVLYVHIADAASTLLGAEAAEKGASRALWHAALARGEAVYADTRGGTGDLPLLPPAATAMCCLSTSRPTECISLRLPLQPDGAAALDQAELVRSVAPPIFALTYATANSWLDRGGHAVLDAAAAAAASLPNFEHSTPQDGRITRVSRGKAGKAVATRRVRSRAHALVDVLLSAYSGAAERTAAEAGAAVPYRHSGATRLGTAPLRRYADLLAQRQLGAVLGDGRKPLPRDAVARAVVAARTTAGKRRAARSVASRALLLEAFSAAVDGQRKATGLTYAVVHDARATGVGTEVYVADAGTSGAVRGVPRAMTPLPKGKAVPVRVAGVDLRTGKLKLDAHGPWRGEE